MTSPLPLPHRLVIASLAFCALAAAGCAGLRLPRIDPTGERIFVWPKDQPTAVAATPVVPGNPTAPAVLTDPFFPAQPAAAVPTVAARPQQVLKVTPERVLAPVGSEVVLKAGICDADGYLIANQKIEWMLGRNGVGQFVEVGGKGHFHRALLPWKQGKKVDNYLATGFTAGVPLCISRGTADPSDDVNILRGDAWISVTSPSEGSSYVTAHAPSVVSWTERRSQAVIHWVDVQWVFPPARFSSGGQPQTLTTTVTRQTNGTPIEGYLVRYEVADGPVALSGATSGQVVEVRTGADGRASVEVSPTDSGAGASTINVELVRPAGMGEANSPRLVVSRGTSTIDWTGDAPYLPTDPLAPAPAPALPDDSPAVPPPAAVGRPQLDVEIWNVSDSEPVEGSAARFQIVVRNNGNAPATNTALNVRFTEGLSHLGDPNRDLQLEKTIGRIEAGQSFDEFMTFDVIRPGRQCIVATAIGQESASSPREACIEVGQAAAEAVARIAVEKVGREFGAEGAVEMFTVRVQNVGDVALTNVEIVDNYPTGVLKPQLRPGETSGEVVDNRVIWRLPRLERGEVKRFDIEARCLAPTLQNPAVTYVEVTGAHETTGAVVSSAAEHELEIRPARGGVAPAPGGPAGATLRIRITDNGIPPTRLDTRRTYRIDVDNLAQQGGPDGQVLVRVVFPPELVPDPNSIQGPPGVRPNIVAGQGQSTEVQFDALQALRPSESATYWISANAQGVGNVIVRAEAKSTQNPTAVADALDVEIIDVQ